MMILYIMHCEKRCWIGDRWVWRCGSEDVIIGHSLDGVRYGIDWDDSIGIESSILVIGSDDGGVIGVIEDKKEILDLLMNLEI